ncbi:MAG: late competence development ComFB family protein [Venatoribacter sp.]
MAISNHIQNYYESLVTEEIQHRANKDYPNQNLDFYTDVACVALNNLPAKYIRYEVDLAFYMSQTEHVQIRNQVAKAVDDALKFVKERKDR